MFQKTIKKIAQCSGVGLHSGAPVSLTMRPAPVHHGIVFVRTDITDRDNVVPALWDRVVDTQLCTLIANDSGITIGTVEHVMSALHASGIDNVIIELNGPEVPIMDGSAEPFLFMIDCAGVEELNAPKRVIKIIDEVVFHDGDKSASLKPSDISSYHFNLDYRGTPIGRQNKTMTMVNGNFRADIARARTFCLSKDVDMMRSAGLIRGGSMDNAIVVDTEKIMNPSGLRYSDEFVRHKILDAIGDLYLAGHTIIGEYHGIKAGHELNNQLLHTLFSNPDSYIIMEGETVCPMPLDHIADAQAAA